MVKKRGPKERVKVLGLENKVFEGIKDGKSVEAMSREFNNKGFTISTQAIRKFLANSKDAQRKLIQSDMKEMKKISNMYLDYEKVLKVGIDELNKKLKRAEELDDLGSWRALYDSMLKTVDLFAKIAGVMKPGGVTDINIIFNKISKEAEKNKEDIFSDSIDIKATIIEEDKKEEDKIQVK